MPPDDLIGRRVVGEAAHGSIRRGPSRYTSGLPSISAVKAISDPSGENLGWRSSPSSSVSLRAGSTIDRRGPHILCVNKNHGIAVDIRESKQRIRGVRHRGRCRDRDQSDDNRRRGSKD